MEQKTPEVLERDPRIAWEDWPGAVLLSDEIEYYSTRSAQVPHPLIEPFASGQLKAASYRLSLGRRAHLGGKLVIVSEDRPLEIPPHQVAVVTTYETLRIPRFLIARWNLRVSMVYEGLLWVGALQVDPGWVGYLLAPLYNLAERTVRLYYKEPLFTMDFVRTTPYRPKISKAYNPERGSLEEYDIHPLESAPYQVLARIDETERRLEAVASMGTTFVVVTVAVLAAIIAALSILVVGPLMESGGEVLDNWALTAISFSAFSAVLSVVALIAFAKDKFWPRRRAGAEGVRANAESDQDADDAQ